MLENIITALISGGITGLVTVATIKNDVRWLKQILQEHKETLGEHAERLTFLERNI